MTLLYPLALILLGVVPIGILFLVWRNQARQNTLQSIGNTELVQQLISQVNTSRRRVKSMMWLMALASLVIALAHPIWGVTAEILSVEGRAILFLVDVSRSMDAQDTSPSRLERAKIDMQRITQQLQGNDFSIVAFAGEAFVYMPMTYDDHSIQSFISALTSQATTNQGTNIYPAINLAVESLADYSAVQKYMIVMSDGENHELSSSEGISLAKDNNIIIHTIGYGTVEGAQIPLYNSDGTVSGYQTDAGNAIVISKLVSGTLGDIATSAGGQLFTVDTVPDLITIINTSDESELQQRSFTQPIERFGIFLLLALMALSIDILLPDNRRVGS